MSVAPGSLISAIVLAADGDKVRLIVILNCSMDQCLEHSGRLGDPELILSSQQGRS